MKKLSVLFLMVLACISAIYAQDDAAKRDKMIKEGREFRLNFVTKEMELTDAQKQKFVPLYEEMCQKRIECSRQVRELEKKLKKKGKELSDAEYNQILETQTQTKEQVAEIEKTYNEKFATFLSPKQLYKLKEAESAFAQKMEEMRHNRKKEHKKK